MAQDISANWVQVVGGSIFRTRPNHPSKTQQVATPARQLAGKARAASKAW